MAKRRKDRPNAIAAAVLSWLAEHHPNGDHPTRTQELLERAPKRFVVYEPMALLPTGSFADLNWSTELDRADATARDALWSSILDELSRRSGSRITHLAVNEGIPPREVDRAAENVRRSPSGLRMLYGDFGPVHDDGGGGGGSETARYDFDAALWVSTKQNGIYQTWAPRWTMFSRGNVKEKARLLGFGSAAASTRHEREHEHEQAAGGWAIDLYAGIGYFAFSYAALGMRVLCWEINPWSVEGLRRGALRNRWPIRVVQGVELDAPLSVADLVEQRIVVFLEDNCHAARRLREFQAMGAARDIRHVNCGLLPTSEPVWRAAWAMTGWTESTAWLHLHENVGSTDKEARRTALQGLLDGWTEEEGRRRAAVVEHVESVKTYAPGVEHVVFDVSISSNMH